MPMVLLGGWLREGTPGVRTFNLWMREDGCTVDKIILTTNASFTLPGTDLGPAESGKRGSTEHLLRVGNGTGDGWYGESTLVSITANAAPPDHVFDHWTGETQFLTATTAASTYALIPTQDMHITATYKLDATADADSDGLLDSWETAHFSGTAVANAVTDSDHDGTPDFAESLAGTDPNDGASTFTVTQLQRTAGGDIVLQWPAAAGQTYSVFTAAEPAGATWIPIAVGIPGTPPQCSHTIRPGTSRGFIRVELE